ncbi:ATP-dependent nuclease [Seonamhaeicola maritimus]|uniref:ATP-dependent nuclease n=1 Tax=Seonamhaeicola maritimus TaxID=2591822 RepID=UPI002494DCB1|nr:AAA family ATPase [Seonamhaeicola maritimus]
MELKKIKITNFRGVSETVSIKLDLFKVIIGRNDAGKSTVLKALDYFLNETTFNPLDKNNSTEDPKVEIELFIKPNKAQVIFDEAIETTFESEEILNNNSLLQVKKTWDTSKSRITAETHFIRKAYNEDDFVLMTENNLIGLCTVKEIQTQKANGEEFNNVEKRQKLREWHANQETEYSYVYEKAPTLGTSRLRTIGKQIKENLPRFEYFRADTSLSETDTAIQNFFKTLATNQLKETEGLIDIQDSIRTKLEEVLNKITGKINQVVPQNEQISPKIEFDWTKLVKTSFSSNNENGDIPLSNRGDGFRRITMMAYFEYLAEQSKTEKQNIVFGFEEPETFLHPSAQENLFGKFLSLCENSYEIIVTTHSPIIVAHTHKEDLIHVSKEDGGISFNQNVENLEEIAEDIGITVSNQFIEMFDKAQALIFVEGADDVIALNHISQKYKQAGEIPHTFDELGIIIIPTGGCGSIKHWVTFNLIEKLGKNFVIFQDSDKKSEDEDSKNIAFLTNLGFTQNVDFLTTKKRELENYIPVEYFNETCPDANLKYDDYDDLKKLCKSNKQREALGSDAVLLTHFSNLTYDHLKSTLFADDEDEFLILYELINNRL